MTSVLIFCPTRSFLDFIKKYNGEIDLQVILNFNTDTIQRAYLGELKLMGDTKPKLMGYLDKTTFISKKEDLLNYLVSLMKNIFKRISTDPLVQNNKNLKESLNKQHASVSELARSVKKCTASVFILVY